MTLPINNMILTHFVSGASTVEDTARALVAAHGRSRGSIETTELLAMLDVDLGAELNTLLRRCAQLIDERDRAA